MPDSFNKDPDEVLDYVRDWSVVLDGDEIATSVWLPVEEAEADQITVDSDSHDETTATVWLSGGNLNVTHKVLNRITTTGGRTFDKTLRFKIKAK